MGQQRRLNGLDQIVKSLRDGAAYITAEPRLRPNAHKVDRNTCVRTDETPTALCLLGTLDHDPKRVPSGFIGLNLVSRLECLHRIGGNATK